MTGSRMMYNKPVTTLKYIGPRKASRLSQLNIKTIGDLIWHFPRRYQDRSRLDDLSTAVYGETVSVQVTVKGWEEKLLRPKLKLYRALIQDQNGWGYGVWFNQSYIRNQLPVGAQVVITGKVTYRNNVPEIQVYDYEILGRDKDAGLHTGRIVPFYPLTAGLSQRWMRLVVNMALEMASKDLIEILPDDLLTKYRLLSRQHAIKYIHYPPDQESLYQAKRRLKYEELLIWELSLHVRRISRREVKGISHGGSNDLVKQFIGKLPFQLTSAQERVLSEVIADMEDNRPMARLLQGDVGSGKTVVAAAAMVKALAGGWQAVLMAPTEVLAEQHGQTLQKLLRPLNIPVTVLTGNASRSERKKVLTGLATGQIPLIVGTHALIQENVFFKSLGLVVIDEQHRFGVNQRTTLVSKGQTPDLLVMTATPIPRSLALTIYGDMDISILDEMPPGRLPVKTYILPESQRYRAYKLIQKEIKNGNQAYVICPLIEESENITAEAAVKIARKLQEEIFPDFKIGLLHGRLHPAEKEEVMLAFRRKEISILVATTVVEVGVDVPNATVMLIEGADRMGLAQLHQLRGRVGRGNRPSYCILMAEDGKYNERLMVLKRVHNGFEIAEADLKLRGPGEFFGTRQHGLPEFHLAKLPEDLRILEQARKDACKLCQNSFWKLPEYKLLWEEVKQKLDKIGF